MPKEATQFRPGHPGKPGRPKGSRNKLSEQFFEDLHDPWKQRGMQTHEEVADTDPHKVMATMAQPLSIEQWQEMHELNDLKSQGIHE